MICFIKRWLRYESVHSTYIHINNVQIKNDAYIAREVIFVKILINTQPGVGYYP